MSEERNLMQAKSAYETLCKMLDNKQWHYDKDEENLVVTCGVQGEDIPIRLLFKVDDKRMLVSLYSFLPFDIPEDKRVETAVATCVINDRLANGNFDFNFFKGKISFRMVTSFRDSILSEELFEYMLVVSTGSIDDYNDKYMMLGKGLVDLNKFMELINQD